jgi:competence protein ComEA
VISTLEPTAVPSPEATSTPTPLRVYVSGAVRNPEVYVLPPGSIVKDAVLAAGGATGDADLDRINLAIELADQQHVYVPHQDEESLPVDIALPSGASSPQSADIKVNINVASAEELTMLPGIGPAIAQRIVAYRVEQGSSGTIEDLMHVKGVGQQTFDGLADQIVVR